MTDVVVDQEYEELLADHQELREEVARLNGENQALSIAKQERDILAQQIDGLRTELEGMRQENGGLRDFKFRTLAICSQPHEKLAPYSKIIAIVGPEMPTYAASELGGALGKQITSMKQLNKAICGTDENSHCAKRNVARLEELGFLKREAVALPDGRNVYEFAWDETLLRHPRFVEVETQRPHNGGDKRCANCGNFCKKRLSIKYECVKCGIDFDQDMAPIAVESPVVQATVEPADVTPPEPTPIRSSAPPLACKTCNNVRVDRWTYSKLLQKWECRDCGSQERGRAS